MVRRTVAGPCLLALLAAGCGNVSGPATLPGAVKPLVTAVQAVTPTQSPDAAFIAAARAQGVKAADDAAALTGAQAVCSELIATDSDAGKQKTLEVDVSTDVSTYGITQAQGVQLVILSAKYYCPEQLASATKAVS